MSKRRRFALPTPEEIERQFHDSLTLMRAVRETLADLLSEASGGGSLRDVGLKQAELETALKRAIEAEAKWDEWQAKQAGEEGGDAPVDYVALREDIACRLARLRDCCQDE